MNISEEKFLENYKNKIIKECIKSIYKKCNINDKKTNEQISDDKLYKILLEQKIIKRCIGCTNTVPINQCSRNAIDNFDYCKTHLYKISLKGENIAKSSINICKDKDIKKDKLNLTKKFIDDTFYYIDEKLIYNTNLEKVGYINNNEYILSSDPFILGIL